MPKGNVEPLTKPAVGLDVTEGVMPVVQLSETVGAVHVATADVPVVGTVILAGQFAKVGGATSFAQGFVTVTVKVQGTALLFAASFAA